MFQQCAKKAHCVLVNNWDYIVIQVKNAEPKVKGPRFGFSTDASRKRCVLALALVPLTKSSTKPPVMFGNFIFAPPDIHATYVLAGSSMMTILDVLALRRKR
eukprot:194147-Amphidinium_carterae.1